MRFKRNKGLIVSGTNDWCMVYNYATGEVMTFGEDEIDRVRALVQRINRALREGEARAELEALRWYHEHKRELRERESRKEECLFEPEDVAHLVCITEKEVKQSDKLNHFEKTEVMKVLRKLSKREKQVFILNRAYMLSLRQTERVIGRPIQYYSYSIKKKLEKVREGAKKFPRRRYSSKTGIENDENLKHQRIIL